MWTIGNANNKKNTFIHNFYGLKATISSIGFPIWILILTIYKNSSIDKSLKFENLGNRWIVDFVKYIKQLIELMKVINWWEGESNSYSISLIKLILNQSNSSHFLSILSPFWMWESSFALVCRFEIFKGFLPDEIA